MIIERSLFVLVVIFVLGGCTDPETVAYAKAYDDCVKAHECTPSIDERAKRNYIRAQYGI